MQFFFLSKKAKYKKSFTLWVVGRRHFCDSRLRLDLSVGTPQRGGLTSISLHIYTHYCHERGKQYIYLTQGTEREMP